jgi:hypothetical protein
MITSSQLMVLKRYNDNPNRKISDIPHQLQQLKAYEREAIRRRRERSFKAFINHPKPMY